MLFQRRRSLCIRSMNTAKETAKILIRLRDVQACLGFRCSPMAYSSLAHIVDISNLSRVSSVKNDLMTYEVSKKSRLSCAITWSGNPEGK